MRGFLARQVAVLTQAINNYREGLLGLNSLIQRMESVLDVIDCDVWEDEFFPLILALEEINAVALDSGVNFARGESFVVEGLLCELEALILKLDLSSRDIGA